METMETNKARWFYVLLRLSLGWTLLWAFLDKTFGLGFATPTERSWLSGGSPTTGFLTNATSGPFASLYQSMAGNVVVDWLFMMGLLLIGLSLILGIGMKVAGYSGALLMLLMWTAVLPKQQNPFMDEHIIYLLVFLLLPTVKAGQWMGLGKWWSSTALVKKYPILE